jgi:ADP-ribose pyrophosphatase
VTSEFRVVDENVVWSNHRFMSLAEVTVEAPTGERLRRDVLHHPGAVAVLPLHDDGTVTLVRQYRAAVDDDIWELPAGLRDVRGEPPAVTATRELVEEVGLAAESVRHLTTFRNSPGCSDETVQIFVATGLSDVPDDRQGVEEQHMEVARIPLAEALAMVGDGRITDAKTVIGLLLARAG